MIIQKQINNIRDNNRTRNPNIRKALTKEQENVLLLAPQEELE